MNTLFRCISLGALLGAVASTPSFAADHGRDTFIAQYDTNHDGKVTRDEFNAARAERFRATDADHNGRVDEGEYLIEYVAVLDGQLRNATDSEDEKTITRQRQYRQTLVRFNVLDKDKDQQISQAEYGASGTRAFNNHDTDKDGVVTIKDAESDEDGRKPTK